MARNARSSAHRLGLSIDAFPRLPKSDRERGCADIRDANPGLEKNHSSQPNNAETDVLCT